MQLGMQLGTALPAAAVTGWLVGEARPCSQCGAAEAGSTALMALRSALLLVHIAHGAASTVTVNWVSDPLRPGSTGLIAGGGFSNFSKVTLTDSSGKATVAAAIDVADGALKFTMPAGAAQVAYDVTVDGSVPFPINVPDAWWWQGDQGNTSTPSGWLRVFGRALAPPATAAQQQVGAATATLEAQLMAAAQQKDFKRAQEIVRELASSADGAIAATGTQIKLTPIADADGSVTDAAPVTLSAVPANTTEYHAMFELPASLAAGSYKAEISSGAVSNSAGEWV